MTIYRTAFMNGLRPDPELTVSEWADAHRRLSSKASAEPGPWRTNRTPYLKEPMDCLSTNSGIQRVVMMFAAQTGKTESGSNWLGYVIAHSPGPMLLVQPTVEMAKRLSKQRLEALISETPCLNDKIAPSRSRDSGNTMLAKEFPGGMMLLTGANSATGLRSTPCRYIFMDEVDAFPADVDGEGDPVSLAEKRATTFARRKILLTSTPTVKDFSRIEAEYLRSDQRRFYVPCPKCGIKEWLKWSQLKWQNNDPNTAQGERVVPTDGSVWRAIWLGEPFGLRWFPYEFEFLAGSRLGWSGEASESELENGISESESFGHPKPRFARPQDR